MTAIPKIFLSISLPLWIVDQLTKWAVVLSFSEPVGDYSATSDPRVPVIDGVLWWWRIHNQGVAFGLGNGTTWAPLIFTSVLFIAIGLVVLFWKRGAFANRPLKLAAALLMAGILGNLTDRLVQGFYLEQFEDQSFLVRLSKGYVVDFIDVKIPGYEKIAPESGGHFPTFNVADSCISIASVLLLISAFRPEEDCRGDEPGSS